MSSTNVLVRTSSDLARTVGPPQSLAPYGHNDIEIARAPKAVVEEHGLDACGAPEPQRPVPFVFILLMASAGALAVLPILGDCSVEMHRVILRVGVSMLLPLVVLQLVVLCGGRGWLLSCFFEGDYAEGATTRELSCLWHPERLQTLEYTSGDVAGKKIETYATWETTAIVEYVENAQGGNRGGGRVVRDEDDFYIGCKCRVHGLKKAPEINGKEGVCQNWLADQGRWRFELSNGTVKDVKPENLKSFDSKSCFTISIPESFGPDIKVNIDSKGELCGNGLPFQAEFDGSAIVAKSGSREGQAWRKAGYWRLDFLTKILMTFALVGLQAIFVSTILPPGVVSEASARLPLNAVFLVDGSASISPQQWTMAIEANKKFIADFTRVYSSDSGKLNVGFVQFSTISRVEQSITHDLSTVNTTLDGMQQMNGNTDMDKALRQCQALLDGYTAAGPKSFDVCVLITDGEDTSYKTEAELKSNVAHDTAVFGIFVGSDRSGADKLQHLVDCGKAKGKSKDGCDFFASATDFNALIQKTHEIAQDVTRGSDMVLCAERSAIIETPFLISLMLPAVLWYVSCCTVTIAKRRITSYNKLNSNQLPMLGDTV